MARTVANGGDTAITSDSLGPNLEILRVGMHIDELCSKSCGGASCSVHEHHVSWGGGGLIIVTTVLQYPDRDCGSGDIFLLLLVKHSMTMKKIAFRSSTLSLTTILLLFLHEPL
jgi:hypothetical protein